MKDYRLEVASSFIHPTWLRTVTGREFEVVVANDGALEVEGDRLRFVGDAPPPGTPVVLRVGRWITCVTAADRDEAARQRAAEDAARLAAEHAALNRHRDEALAQAGALNLPFRWSPAIKDVLSGLSESSWGDGRNRSTVEHILLLEPLADGRLTRDAGDFLCTARSGSNGKRWSSGAEGSVAVDGDGQPYPAKVTCKTCLKLAARWRDR
ncbi:hypothetical protein [Xanthomonas vasicola]|uniref:hypothetical protein n=1 Tax=Xanthomonas vasicola TaxID=56459 RepID=UPI0020C49E06|nr:hypothetical protein [Xanthomonas vasicola]